MSFFVNRRFPRVGRVLPRLPPAYPKEPAHMADTPLSHHEILVLAEPFTRSGRQVDLAACDRIERQVVFRPQERSLPAGAAGDAPVRVSERLELQDLSAGRFRLVRTLEHPGGLAATLTVDGADPAEMLSRLERVDPARHFAQAEGVPIAHSFRLTRDEVDRKGHTILAEPLLVRSAARLPGLKIELISRDAPGGPAALELGPEGDDAPRLPEDFLAVLGSKWRPLRKTLKGGLRSGIWASAREPARTRQLQARLARTVAHAARSLAEPPALWHGRYASARWWASTRRALLLLFVIALLMAGPGLELLDVPQGSVLRLLAHMLPPMLLVIAFISPELPSFSLPPIPRQLPADAWRPRRLGEEGVVVEPAPLPTALRA